jgi:large subunit ribosomal protein L4e
MKLSRSLPGVDVIAVDSLNVMDLFPGSKPIRLTVYSQNAIDVLKKLNASGANLEKNTK